MTILENRWLFDGHDIRRFWSERTWRKYTLAPKGPMTAAECNDYVATLPNDPDAIPAPPR